MEAFFERLLARFAPRLGKALATLVQASEEDPDGIAGRIVHYEQELRELRAEIDELRRDSLRAAELYDLVFERLKSERRLGD